MEQPRIFVERHYDKTRKKSGITDQQLRDVAAEVVNNPDKGGLGGGVYKKRIATATGQGKSGGARTIIAYHREGKVFFFEGWEKNTVSKSGKEIPDDVLDAFKIASTVFKNKSDADIEIDLKNKELIEVKNG
ncbi:type II toxin-antitoxin system RelE/ParE family toxin [Dickeya dadantii]|uniref:type II toxin-antitoxin system RelE/ParE family toxin n=1 Tax=Dickeya dadantii TaxID=204038 RepID=UPI001CF24937|nr:type II toxin-antitoxin system RelE/ParE family toxin [Dickeya dadantii]MCA7014887.1 type II toxin-antitoxin system RelE/ParE family toxin [Dickeya dadantii]